MGRGADERRDGRKPLRICKSTFLTGDVFQYNRRLRTQERSKWGK